MMRLSATLMRRAAGAAAGDVVAELIEAEEGELRSPDDEDSAACRPDAPEGSGLFAGFDEGVMCSSQVNIEVSNVRIIKVSA
jgi:hypothetical protein